MINIRGANIFAPIHHIKVFGSVRKTFVIYKEFINPVISNNTEIMIEQGFRRGSIARYLNELELIGH